MSFRSPFVKDAMSRVQRLRVKYADAMWAQYTEAETELNGKLLNRRGQAQKVDAVRLFSGPQGYAMAYASEELMEWWRTHPRMSFEDFERQAYEAWLNGLEF